MMALAAICGLVFYWFQGRFGFYGDEGLNLAKAMMVRRGYSLYRDIYSDQAPLYTWLLALGMRAAGDNSTVLGAIPIAFGVLAVIGGAAIARELAGAWAATICVGLVAFWAPMAKFGTSAVITMPMLAMGTWALWCAVRYTKHQSLVWLGASGSLLGVACLFKLGGGYFFPIIMGAIFVRRPGDTRPALRTALGVWFGAALVPLLVWVKLGSFKALYSQLYAPHAVAFLHSSREAAVARAKMFLAPGMTALYASACLGAVFVWRRLGRQALVLWIWLLTAASWVLAVRPLWSHHFPDFLLPLAVCIAVSLVLGVRELKASVPRAVAVAVTAGLLVVGEVAAVRSYDYWRAWYDGPSEESLAAVARTIARLTPPDGWVIVDQPMLAFLAARRVPPDLVVLTSKRVNSGGLPEDELCDALDRYKPLVVFCSPLLDGLVNLRTKLGVQYEVVAETRMATSFGVAEAPVCRVMKRVAP
jgi:4-amino-4-deoxy-L-arabinose transferase-like glycosyltransferase